MNPYLCRSNRSHDIGKIYERYNKYNIIHYNRFRESTSTKNEIFGVLLNTFEGFMLEPFAGAVCNLVIH